MKTTLFDHIENEMQTRTSRAGPRSKPRTGPRGPTPTVVPPAPAPAAPAQAQAPAQVETIESYMRYRQVPWDELD